MRKRAGWMQQLDERILEHIHEEEWASPKTMVRVEELRGSLPRISERCEWMHRAGLIAPLYRGADAYELTSEGLLYLRGSLDAENLTDPRGVEQTIQRRRWVCF